MEFNIGRKLIKNQGIEGKDHSTQVLSQNCRLRYDNRRKPETRWREQVSISTYRRE